MSKIADKLNEFLEEGGYQLGYTFDDHPKLESLDEILRLGIHVWEYHGCQTEKEYYEMK
tara:strand:- start:260 stop:436 length:177 start_codon:yes stop_codon:yes gene_type:complete